MLYKNTSGLFRLSNQGFGRIRSMRVRTVHGLRTRSRLSYMVDIWDSPELVDLPRLFSLHGHLVFELDLDGIITDLKHLEYLCIQHLLEEVTVRGPDTLDELRARLPSGRKGDLLARCNFIEDGQSITVWLRNLCVQQEYQQESGQGLQHVLNRITYSAYLDTESDDSDQTSLKFMVDDTSSTSLELVIPNHLYEDKDLEFTPADSTELLAPCSTLQLYRRFADHYRQLKT